MASVNIGGQDDEFNRYKMPSVIAKVEGRGNGIKTRIVNCFEVARALHRPPGYVCKFFGCELGAQTKIDDNEGTYIVNGSFQQNVLQDVLKKFIDMFVLCSGCSLPETDLKLRKNGSISQVCNACGVDAPVDMTHKLCTFIVNNPPDGKKKKSDGKKDKAARRAAKAKKSAEAKCNGQNQPDENVKGSSVKKTKKKHRNVEDDTVTGSMLGEDMEEEVGLIGDFDLLNADLHTESNKFDSFGDGGNVEIGNDDVEWSVDTSKEAEESRMRELGAAASILERGATNDNADVERATKLRAYIDDGKRPSKVLTKAEKLFGERDAIRGLMLSATHGESLTSIPESVERRVVPVFQYLGQPMAVEAQSAFLSYLDWAGSEGETASKITQVLPHMLKMMYDAEVLDEKEIMKWHTTTDGPDNVRKAVEIIIEWLNEEDGDDDEESDE